MTEQQDSEYPSRVAAECQRIGKRIAKRAARARLSLFGLRVLMSVVGLSAILAAYVPTVTAVVGEAGARAISLLAAFTLLVTAVVSVFVDKNPPERYVDYSRYILGYTGRAEQIQADASLAPDIKSARLDEILILANKNIEDVRSMWPWIDDGK